MTLRRQIMIVDDDLWWSASLRRSLKNDEFSFSEAAHGLMAIDMIDDMRPDAIILDLFLPGPNGLALIHELKSHSDLATIPIIIVSSMGDKTVRRSLLKYGIHDVFDKGTVNALEIAAALRKALA